MDSIYESTMLYDFYGELLTANQKEVLRLRFTEDLSLGEISEILNISRQGVHDCIHRAEKALVEYEEALHLVARFLENRERTLEIRNLALKARQASGEAQQALLDAIIKHTMEIE